MRQICLPSLCNADNETETYLSLCHKSNRFFLLVSRNTLEILYTPKKKCYKLRRMEMKQKKY